MGKLIIEDLNIYFGDKEIVKNISMEIRENKITSIIGPSGCGKTTFINSLNRMIEEKGGSTKGSILLDGLDIRDQPKEYIRRNIGMVFQTPTAFPLSIYKNLTYGLNYYGIKGKKEVREIVERSLRSVGLYDEVKGDLKMSARDLSGGQQQRLCIARALSVDPKILILDEPCSALDIKNTAKIEDLLLELQGDYTIVIVTHNLAQAKRISDYTAFFLNGELVEYDETSKIFSSPKDPRTRDYIEGIYG